MEKPNWIIHYIQEHDCQNCGKHSHPTETVGFPGFGNAHTHGFKENGHDEICIAFDIGPNGACNLLNEIGFRIRENGEKFEVGMNTDILANDMRVEFYRPEGAEQIYMLLPDTEGLLPGEDGCMQPYSFQRIYADIIEEDTREMMEEIVKEIELGEE